MGFGVWAFHGGIHDVFIFILFKGIEGSPGIMIIVCQVVLKAHPMHHFTNASAHKHTHTQTHIFHLHISTFTSYIYIYILHTSYIHLIYILCILDAFFTSYIHIIYFLVIYYHINLIYILYSSYLHLIYILYTSYILFGYILSY